MRWDAFECPREDCDRAYVHPLLRDYHIVADHQLALDVEGGAR